MELEEMKTTICVSRKKHLTLQMLLDFIIYKY